MNFTKMVTKRFGLIISLVGVNKRVLDLGDVNDSLLAKGLRSNGNEVVTLSMTEGSDIKWNLDEGIPDFLSKFDVIVAGELLEHIYFLNKFLQGIKKLLKPKGYFVLSLPNICALKSRVKMLFGKLPTYCADADKYHEESGYTGHIRDFNVCEILYYLEINNWFVKEIGSTGLWIRGHEVIPHNFCLPSFGDCIIIKAEKEQK